MARDLAHSRPHRYYKSAPIKPLANFIKAVDHVLENCLSSLEANRGPAPITKLGDARSLGLADGAVDLVLTSPPYLNAIDYLRCSKFSLVWMGRNTDELRTLRSKSVGTEVGEYGKSQGFLAKKLIGDLRLKSRLSERHQALLAHFISDMHLAIEEVAHVLAPGGKAIYVVGENTVRGTYIKREDNYRVSRKRGTKLQNQIKRALPPNRRYLPPPTRRKGNAALDGRMRREVILTFVKRKS